MTKKDWLVLAGIILFTSLSSQVRAQQDRVEIKGTVVESTGFEPLEAATVRLLSGNDSTMMAAVAAVQDGAFLLKNIPSGTYLLHVTYVGFEPVYQPLQVSPYMESVDIGRIEMEEGIVYLDEVVVAANFKELEIFAVNSDMSKLLEKFSLELSTKKMPEVVESSDGKVTVSPVISHRQLD